MSWLFLGIAGVMELLFVLCLEKGQKNQNRWWLVLAVLAMLTSIVLLGKVTQVLPLGVAYAIWTGLGSLLSVGYGILFLGESCRPLRLFFVFCIAAGVAGLKIFG